jgi:hypothetical protein
MSETGGWVEISEQGGEGIWGNVIGHDYLAKRLLASHDDVASLLPFYDES